MATRSNQHLSIVEAVETLSSIADLEFDRDVGIAQKHEMLLIDEKIAYKTVHWLHKDDTPSTVNLVREIFRVILHYLRQFYKKEYGQVTDQQALEGIKTIMVLVGEAAKKLDKYTEIFHQTQKVTDFIEYKQLQEFFENKIARKLEEGALGKWVLGLKLEKPPSKITFRAAPRKTDRLTDTKHHFVDFEMGKKDTDYELFFIRKEDGSRFFSPRLLRNIKLVCDFGSYFGERKEEDPLEHVKEWVDRVMHVSAREILKVLGNRLNRFFKETRKAKEQELVEWLNKALLALLLCSHSQNLLRHHPIKSCTEYFEDFQKFLRAALQTEIYQKWMTSPPKESHPFASDLIDLVHTLCRALYANLQGLEEMKPVIQNLMQQGESLVPQEKGNKEIWNQLAEGYTALAKLLQRHPNGPLLKVIEMIGENAFQAFDSILQHNIPNQLFDLYAQNKRIAFLRIPAPIYQEFINRAIVNAEFRGFLRSHQAEAQRKHLLINLQDRTSWREHVRCLALEELQNQPEMEDVICVVTLATHTDFYHQLSPYHQVNQVQLFKEQFKELLLDEHAGYYFPPSINRKGLTEFIDETFKVIHRTFFSSKNVLTRENRLDFIEIFYWFLELKLIEWSEADSVSLTSKDAIDMGESDSAGIFVLLKWLNNQEWTKEDAEHLNFMLYAPALLIRERVMLPDRFNRFLSALKAIENARQELGAEKFVKVMQESLLRLFSTTLLQAQVLLPR